MFAIVKSPFFFFCGTERVFLNLARLFVSVISFSVDTIPLTVLEEHMRSIRGMLETLITKLSYISGCEYGDLIPYAYEIAFRIPIPTRECIDIYSILRRLSIALYNRRRNSH